MKLAFYAIVVLALTACAGMGGTAPPAHAQTQTTQYARATLNSVYDTVVTLRQGCHETPKASTCKMSDAQKANVLAVAGAVDDELKLIETTANPTTEQCLAAVNAGLAKADQNIVPAASSCLDLAVQVLTTLQTNLGSKK
jgi:hypothetical protein